MFLGQVFDKQGMAYVLEDEKEFDRFERQSALPLYDPEKELKGIRFGRVRRVLDAGSGSGLVSRFLAKKWPKAQITGIDISAQSVKRAQQTALEAGLKNVVYQQGSLEQITASAGYFDVVVCRFVLEHLSLAATQKALGEIYRCLRPGGRVVVIDIDGLFHNVYPRSPRMQSFLDRLLQVPSLDLQIGRKIPSLLDATGFRKVMWRIETMDFQKESIDEEIRLVEERLSQAFKAVTQIMGSEAEARQLQKEYLEQLHLPSTVLFYNKFIVTAEKAGLRVL